MGLECESWRELTGGKIVESGWYWIGDGTI